MENETPFYEWGRGVADEPTTPFYEWGRGVAEQPGYNADGTFSTPTAGRTSTPVDAGGGPAGVYAPQIIDIFKFGVGVWNQQEQQKAMLDYKRFEATQLGVFAQGQPALTFSSGGQILGGTSGVLLIAVLAFVLLKGK